VLVTSMRLDLLILADSVNGEIHLSGILRSFINLIKGEIVTLWLVVSESGGRGKAVYT
jgi:hypothetical protein